MTNSPAGKNPDVVRDALSKCTSFEDVKDLGILFHGTCENIKGDLRGGGYDDVLWAARKPTIAQAYIPKAGIKTWIHEPGEDERDDHLKPSKNDDFIMRWALEKSGATREDLEITWDGMRPWSFTIVKDWPTEGDFDDWIKSLGYEADDRGVYNVSLRYIDNVETLLPSDWSMPGHLLIALPGEDFKEVEPDWSEDALGYASHNRVVDFADFSDQGIDAFHMEDYLQSDHLGNVGHESVGILAAGKDKLSWMAIPVTRYDGDSHDVFYLSETPEFAAFMKELNPTYQTEADLSKTSVADPFKVIPEPENNESLEL
jgi:hypothetical protein